MTAHRPRRTSPLDDTSILEFLYFGVPAQRAVRHGAWVPPTDVYETADQVVVKVEIAGVKQSDLCVSLSDRRLLVTGARVDGGPARRAFHQMEIHYGDFRVELELPAPVDDSRVDAEYNDGILRIVLPKLPPRGASAKE